MMQFCVVFENSTCATQNSVNRNSKCAVLCAGARQSRQGTTCGGGSGASGWCAGCWLPHHTGLLHTPWSTGALWCLCAMVAQSPKLYCMRF